MNRPQSRNDFRALPTTTLRALYAVCRDALAELDGVAAAVIDAEMDAAAADLAWAGWRRDEALASVALQSLMANSTTTHAQISPETEQWGGFLSADTFVTTERHAAAWRAIEAKLA